MKRKGIISVYVWIDAILEISLLESISVKVLLKIGMSDEWTRFGYFVMSYSVRRFGILL